MRPSFPRWMLLPILSLGVCSPLRAEIMGALTIEWLTCSSDVVAVGRVTAVESLKGPGEVMYEDCVFAIDEVIKGGVEKRVSFTYRRFPQIHPDPRAWQASGKPMVVFLKVSRENGDEKRLDGVLVPTSQSFPLSLIECDAPGKFAMDGTFRVLKTKEEILEVARRSAEALKAHLRENPGAEIEERRLEVPWDSEAHRNLYGGSRCFLTVPAFMYPQSNP